ncbi:hypothetical protein KUTeg_010791 [Tegillarca granosa]|uniref:FAS1 domain-containing protein n=1 Tax=Tegillarca granosa TaxID=220873 RepID=A0ABQ9F213_TEGGR|nr:hypothetical protein KUTeg_010791 [Tegillarca granosa]
MDVVYFLFFFLLLVCSGGVKTKTVLEIIQYNNSMRQVSSYIGRHGLSSYFDQQNITAFLPTDRVFRTYHSSVYGYNMSDTVTVESLFLYHLVGRKIQVSDIRDNTTAHSLHPSSYRLYFNILMDGSTKVYSVNGAVLVSTDIIASNGIIHIIDRVIAPVSSAKTLHDYLLKPDMPALEFRSIAMASIIDMELKGNTNNSGYVFTAYAPNDSYLIPTMPEYAKDILYDVSNLEFLKKVVHAHTIPDYVQFLPSSWRSNNKTILHELCQLTNLQGKRGNVCYV